jgi:transposase
MLLPDHLPVNEIILEPEQDTTGMVCIGQEITEELDYTPARLFKNRYIRNKYITKEDEKANQKQVIAPLNRPLHKCIASANLLAMIFTNKYLYHLPVYRTRRMLIQMGVTIPESTIESWIKLGTNLLRPLYGVHRLYVFREIYQMIDESPIRVQDRRKKGTCHKGYMWVRYAPLSKSVLFEYYKSRSANGPIDDLNSFQGFVQTDGYSGYTFLAGKAGLTHLSCWAHARRYFEAALKNDKERASHVLSLIQLLYSIETIARDQNLSHEQRHALRLEKSLPVINEIGTYINKHKSSVMPRSPLGKAFEYCKNRWTSLQNYLTNGMLEIDSSPVENAIRPLALGRKNYLFAGSHDAAKNIAMFYSFFGTCKKLEIDPQMWLKYVMENIHTTPSENFKELLPQFIDKSVLQK